ncbi:hypothetical protein PCYB_123820 [Plasmodium cynomolgi strain B]|uniref:Uncharacterized protein n=1 Tax=Plasmodium cynomolgi (strain B) TaxID=1120755 RepID=K6UE66_PLACD|nr:hypothetical protein PCYB_123820 [Plasmodium cynomolgi strain B]GAB67816.1 hypothetical protein PCYB_123820 [Plasmodium cynomolgi strain B]
MNSYRKHSASFYVLDAAAYGGDFSALWRDLEFAPTEDIVIISVKNDSRDNHLRTAIKAKLEQRACRNGEHMLYDAHEQYELVDPNFQFEGNSFMLMVRVELRNDIKQVHCKSVQLRYLEENVRFGTTQSRGKRKEYHPTPPDQQNSHDMVRHIYVYPYKGIVQKNEQKKINLNIYVDHMLKTDQVVKGSFILIIRIQKDGKDIKQIFFTCKYSLRNNIVSALLREDLPLVRGLGSSNRTSVKGRSWSSRTTTITTTTTGRTNMSLHSRSRRNSLWSSKFTKRLEETKGRPFLPVNVTKFVLYSFFAIDRYERELLSRVGTPLEGVLPSQEADQPLHLLGLSNVRTDHLVYCSSPAFSFSTSLQGENKKGVHCNLNYNWKKHFFCVQYPQQKYMDENFFLQNGYMQKSKGERQHLEGDILLQVHYLVGQLQNNGKVDRPIYVATILLLWEELLTVLTPPLGTFAKVTQLVRRIHKNPRLRERKKMHSIFRVIVKHSPSVLYKNFFFILLSFLKKLFFYFVRVCLHDFGVSMRGTQIQRGHMRGTQIQRGHMRGTQIQRGHMSGGPFGKYYSPLATPAQVGPPPPSFSLFLRSFHFFYVSFLSYVSTFFLSFLDHQIALDLAHYLLFHA